MWVIMKTFSQLKLNPCTKLVLFFLFFFCYEKREKLISVLFLAG